jgi:N-acetylglutamate synthase-like GNAT family acetyltransferase
MEIRFATQDDIPQLTKINKEFFGEDRDYEKEMQSKNVQVYVCEENGEIVGITGLRHHIWNNSVWIFNIFVHPDKRGQGIGSYLIKDMIEKAKGTEARCILAEAPSKGNTPALFQKCGFRKCGYNDRYYSNSEDEIAEFYSYDLK